MKRLGFVLVLALALAGCSSGSVPAKNVPPAGTVWFGTSFDTTTFVLSGQASTFPHGQVAMVAHFEHKVPGGQAVSLQIDGVAFGSQTASASDYDVYGLMLSAIYLPVGSHTVSIDDAGGNSLAAGTVTITP